MGMISGWVGRVIRRLPKAVRWSGEHVRRLLQGRPPALGLPGVSMSQPARGSRHRKTFVRVDAGRRNVLLMRLLGLVSHRRRRTFMGNGSGVSRGDRNRNARLGRLRLLGPTTNAIVGIDLADNKQMVVVTDHDSKVLARKTFRCR